MYHPLLAAFKASRTRSPALCLLKVKHEIHSPCELVVVKAQYKARVAKWIHLGDKLLPTALSLCCQRCMIRTHIVAAEKLLIALRENPPFLLLCIGPLNMGL